MKTYGYFKLTAYQIVHSKTSHQDSFDKISVYMNQFNNCIQYTLSITSENTQWITGKTL